MIRYSAKRILPVVLGSGVIISAVYIIIYKWYTDLPDALLHLAHGIIITSGLWIGCMSIAMHLWEKYPWEHKPFRHLFLEIILITSYTLLFSWALNRLELWAGLKMPHQELIAEISITLLITYFITAIHEAVFFYVQWKENFSKSVQLERDKLEANYETLKAQVNPHFIFNSLNSLATLVDDKKEAIEYIDNLSAFLRFILNPAQKELVYLKEEMDIVYNFIKLQKSRFRDNLFFTILIPDHYEKYLVPPLCIQMLVDNCLKHNIISTDKPLRISITVENGSIIIENNLQRKANKSSTGQGLKNIINRLSFFTIRKVEITENNDIFRVKLPLLTAEA